MKNICVKCADVDFEDKYKLNIISIDLTADWQRTTQISSNSIY